MSNSNRSAEPFSQHAFGNSVELLSETPKVLMSRAAYNRMWHYVDLSEKEVGWLGTVRQLDNNFLIEEVFLFEQKVSSTSTEITPDGLAKVAQSILESRGDGMEVLNNLRFWGHSHVEMSTSPSVQDEEQMSVFRGSGHPFFIRAILNKKGRMEFTIFLYESGLKVVDAAWAVFEPVDVSIREEIEAELAEKVTNKREPYFLSTLADGAEEFSLEGMEDFLRGGSRFRSKRFRHARR